ncbi:hypothetical protein Tco_1286958 [Tanacetum coccineum]
MDLMISLGQKNTLAEYMILFGADNRLPIMILESVEHGPLIWPTVEENGVIRTKKYDELYAAKKIQADCDMKATNIILQGLLCHTPRWGLDGIRVRRRDFIEHLK